MKSIKYNAIMNSILTVANMIFPLITFPYVSRILMVEGTGKIAFYSSIASYCTMFASLGLSTYGIKACAKVRDDREKLSRTVQELFIINTVMTIIVCLSMSVLVIVVPKFQRDVLLLLINMVGVVMNVFSINWLYSALEKYDYITVRSILFKIISLLLMFLLVKNKDDVLLYSAITVLANVGGYVCNFMYARKLVYFKRKTKYNFRQHIKPMLILFTSIFAIEIYINLDVVMLGFLKNENSVGIYNVAIKVKRILVSIINAVSVVLLPRLTYYVEKREINKYYVLIKKAFSLSLFISIPLVAFFSIFSHETVFILAGNGYEKAAKCMMIIMPMIIFSGISNVTGNQVLIVLNREKKYLIAVCIGAVVDILLNLILIPLYAEGGASVATLIAEITQTMIQFYFCKDILRNCFELKEIIKIIFGTFISGICVLLFKDMIDSVVIRVIVFSLIFGVVYVTVELVCKYQYLKEFIIKPVERKKAI